MGRGAIDLGKLNVALGASVFAFAATVMAAFGRAPSWSLWFLPEAIRKPQDSYGYSFGGNAPLLAIFVILLLGIGLIATGAIGVLSGEVWFVGRGDGIYLISRVLQPSLYWFLEVFYLFGGTISVLFGFRELWGGS
ncbi:hypothetical protein ATO7_07252 [Oceanococcus atlanticus]|uniref:Uncharacterized protein n=2 Tax=Oceanococcus atlanticus TaxID=1317117 RepID=A0A1Y1SCS8_9GAMM|nr:hypothetical protein ATO7_07252 [Oceanococcus atlanticus]